MKEIKFNCNEYAKVKLTDAGLKELVNKFGTTILCRVDNEGWYKNQLWTIISDFKHCNYVCEQPFDSNIILLSED